MKVFIDTNVLLDFMCRREPFYADAYNIVRKAAMHEIELAVSALTIINTQYTARKYEFSADDISSTIRNLLTLISVSPIDGEMVRYAYSVEDKDKEDVLQYMSARSIEADYIVSRDKKGFANSPIVVLTPKEFLESFSQAQTK